MSVVVYAPALALSQGINLFHPNWISSDDVNGVEIKINDFYGFFKNPQWQE
jgi:hypothetical protein